MRWWLLALSLAALAPGGCGNGGIATDGTIPDRSSTVDTAAGVVVGSDLVAAIVDEAAAQDGAAAAPDLTTVGAMDAAARPDAGSYPPGPYGVKVGDTLADVTATGYPLSVQHNDPTQLTYSPIRLSDAHFNSTCQCLLINISASWCPPCKAEQPVLVNLLKNDPSVCVYQVLYENLGYELPARGDVDQWTQYYRQNFPVVANDDEAAAHLPYPVYLPTNVEVDPVTMKIHAIDYGAPDWKEFAARCHCHDGVKNGAETDVDCGGLYCGPCGAGQTCAVAKDCASGVCAGGQCAVATCGDGVKNAGESDVDCGGACAGCASGKACGDGGACAGAVCTVGICQTANCSDGVMNQGESDVDCGGPCPACGDGKHCAAGGDCAGALCANGSCAAHCNNQLKDGNETEVDCGGICPGCAAGQACLAGGDCQGRVCGGGKCVAPSCTDQMKNGGEAGIDCGGPCSACGAAPALSAVTPGVGPSTGGGTLVIAGSNFAAGSGLAVTVGGVPASSVTWVSATQLSAVLPANPGASGKVAVTVKNPDGQVASAMLFTYALAQIDFAARRYPVGSAPRSMAAADFNLDGKSDLAVVSAGENAVDVLLGKGDGSLGRATRFATDTSPYALAATDVDGDGKPDLVVGNYHGYDVGVALGRGDGSFPAPTEFGVATGPAYVAAGDLDGDGKTDLVVANAIDKSISVLLGRGDGTMGTAATSGLGFKTHEIALGDFNRDGKLDVAVATDGGVQVLLGAGGGKLLPAVIYTAGYPYSLVAADWNGDGKTDLAVAERGYGYVDTYLGNGDGTFQAAVPSATMDLPLSLAVGDFNGDGGPDLAVGSDYGGTGVTILLGKGGAAFQVGGHFAAGSLGYRTVAADWNGDGKTDLAVAGAASNDVTVLVNTSR